MLRGLRGGLRRGQVGVDRRAVAGGGGAAVLAGTVYVACLDGERLRRIRPGGRSDAPLLVEQYGRLSDVAVAPDRSLWILTSNDDRGTPVAEDDRILALDLADGT